MPTGAAEDTSKSEPCLLDCFLIAWLALNVLQPCLDSRPVSSTGPQLSCQDEARREPHHRVRRRDMVANQELSVSRLQFCLQPVGAALPVHAELLLHLRQEVLLASFGHLPTGIQQRERVDHERAFGGCDPFSDFCASRPFGWDQAV